MANARNITVADDDLTGVTGETTSVKIMFDGKTATLDLLPASRDALAALVNGDGAGALVKVFGQSGTRQPARTRSAPRSGQPAGDGAAKREWLRSNGYPQLAERGKFSAEMNERYAAHTARQLGATAGAQRPASTPATASARATAPASASAGKTA
jgi:Lsr2